METTILVLDSGVEMWKVTPSKSETIWSMEVGAALGGVSIQAGRACTWRGCSGGLGRRHWAGEAYPEKRSLSSDSMSTFW